MSKNPIVNALSASAYIVLIVTIFNLLTHTLKDKPDTFGAPLTSLSLFTLSAAVMGYLFFYHLLLNLNFSPNILYIALIPKLIP